MYKKSDRGQLNIQRLPRTDAESVPTVRWFNIIMHTCHNLLIHESRSVLTGKYQRGPMRAEPCCMQDATSLQLPCSTFGAEDDRQNAACLPLPLIIMSTRPPVWFQRFFQLCSQPLERPPTNSHGSIFLGDVPQIFLLIFSVTRMTARFLSVSVS